MWSKVLKTTEKVLYFPGHTFTDYRAEFKKLSDVFFMPEAVVASDQRSAYVADGWGSFLKLQCFTSSNCTYAMADEKSKNQHDAGIWTSWNLIRYPGGANNLYGGRGKMLAVPDEPWNELP